MLASSVLFPVIETTFRLPNLKLALLTFLLSLFLCTDLPPLLLCLRPTVVQFSTVPCRLTALLAVVVDPIYDRSGMEIVFVIRMMIWL